MASGHYVTYVCSRDTALDCATCTRDKRKTASLSGGAGKPPPNSIIDKQNSLLRCVRSFQTFTNIYTQRSPNRQEINQIATRFKSLSNRLPLIRLVWYLSGAKLQEIPNHQVLSPNAVRSVALRVGF